MSFFQMGAEDRLKKTPARLPTAATGHYTPSLRRSHPPSTPDISCVARIARNQVPIGFMARRVRVRSPLQGVFLKSRHTSPLPPLLINVPGQHS